MPRRTLIRRSGARALVAAAIAAAALAVVGLALAASGQISTGAFGFSGDGGPTSAAALNFPSVAVTPNGDLLIADQFNHSVRRVSP